MSLLGDIGRAFGGAVAGGIGGALGGAIGGPGGAAIGSAAGKAIGGALSGRGGGSAMPGSGFGGLAGNRGSGGLGGFVGGGLPSAMRLALPSPATLAPASLLDPGVPGPGIFSPTQPPAGYHLSKRPPYKFVRNRRMNVMNHRAAMRAIRRIKGARKMLQKIERQLPKARTTRRAPAHHHHARGGVV